MSDKETLERLPAVGVDFMDDDHEEAFALLDRIVGSLEGLVDADPEPPGLRRDLRDFIEHSRQHFRHEELEMQRAGYSPLPIHKQEHDQRLEELVGYVDDLDAGVISLQGLKSRFLDEFVPWYHKHCSTMDKATAKFLEANPVSENKPCDQCWVVTQKKRPV
ncbi:hemerythrin [Ectothiorhodosinus mongolicus]|uniref:Hemerythrin n=1 Tax=Ectothiorhodosinus mongolicus TaxID=233100 RepID=A0A1R3VMV0_9GAMM|nr:hemerythrin family protein [Ectothiorhodosinus mongolicus]SIT65804.1 hemerythrin [Ectothiorhodosinus mongolicus]